MIKNIFLLFLITTISTVSAQNLPVAHDALLFKVDFENNCDATIANGNDKAYQIRGKATYLPGLDGKAILSGKGNACIIYECKDNINFDNPGSIVMFFKSNSNWHKTAQPGITLWGLGNNKGYIGLRISNHPKNICPCRRTFELLILDVKGRKNKGYYLQMPALSRICKNFHMISIAWAGSNLYMSCDGQNYRVFPQVRPLSNQDFANSKRFAVGNTTSSFLIDDFRIYGKKLSDEELSSIWERNKDKTK
jgi:hypothetical protein